MGSNLYKERPIAPFVAMPFASSSFLFLVVRPGAPLVASLLLVAMATGSSSHPTYQAHISRDLWCGNTWQQIDEQMHLE